MAQTTYLTKVIKKIGYESSTILQLETDHPVDLAAIFQVVQRAHVSAQPRRPRGWNASLDKKSALAPKKR